jgi:hypothetical protein
VFADNVNAHIHSPKSETAEHIVWHILQAPGVRVASNMLEVEHAELLEDIASNLLVVACAHLGEGVSGLLVPFLAFGDELVEEGIARGGPPQEDGVKKRFHGNEDLRPTVT